MSKPAVKSRTNRTVGLLIATVVGERIARRVGMEPNEVTDALLGLVDVVLGAVAVYYRQQANRQPEDRQDVLTPKPKKRAATSD